MIANKKGNGKSSRMKTQLITFFDSYTLIYAINKLDA